MELSDLEKTVLQSFKEGEVMTLKMVSKKLEKPMSPSKQRIWRALQLLVARNLLEKIDRGVYRLASREG